MIGFHKSDGGIVMGAIEEMWNAFYANFKSEIEFCNDEI